MQTNFMLFILFFLAYNTENQVFSGHQNNPEHLQNCSTFSKTSRQAYGNEMTGQHNLTLTQTADLVTSLKRHYHLGCLILVHTSEHNAWTIAMFKKLSQDGEMASFIGAKDLNFTATAYLCSKNRPFFVMFSGKEIKLSLEAMGKVSSYPRWLLFLSTQDQNDFFQNINVPFDCEFLVAESPDFNIVRLKEVFRISKEMKLNEGFYGAWDAEEGLSPPKLPFYSRRPSLQGIVMQGVTLTGVPYGTLPKKASGIFGAVWRILESRLNFTTVLRRPEDTSYGHQVENGSWYGVVGMIWDGRATVAVDDIAMNKYRLEVVDFLMPILRSPVRIYIRKPHARVVEWNNFSPLARQIWLGVVVSVLGVGVALGVAHSLYVQHNLDIGGECKGSFLKLHCAIFHVYGLFCQQGISDPVHQCSSRIVLFFAGAASVILLSAYSGALTSLLAISKPDLPFKTMQEFVDDGTYSLSTSKKSYQGYFDQDEDNPVIREMYKRFIEPNIHTFPASSEEGLTRVCREDRYAWVTSGMYRYSDVYVTKHFRCKIVEIPEYLHMHSISMVISKDSAFKGIINHNLHYLRDSGILNRIKVAFLADRLSDLSAKLPEVTLDKIMAIGLVLGTGMVVSVLVLMLEKLNDYYATKKKIH